MTASIHENEAKKRKCKQKKSRRDFIHALKGSLKTEYSEILTIKEAAEYLRVSVGTLRNMTSDGLVPYTKLGNRNRYFLEDLRSLLLSNKKGGSDGI